MNHFANNGKEYLRKKSSTEDDIKYRQGRSKKQVENNEKIMFIALIGLGIVLLGIIISSRSQVTASSSKILAKE